MENKKLPYKMIRREEIDNLGLQIGSQTPFNNSDIIKALFQHNQLLNGAKDIFTLKQSFLKNPMFDGLKIV